MPLYKLQWLLKQSLCCLSKYMATSTNLGSSFLFKIVLGSFREKMWSRINSFTSRRHTHNNKTFTAACFGHGKQLWLIVTITSNVTNVIKLFCGNSAEVTKNTEINKRDVCSVHKWKFMLALPVALYTI